MDHHAHHGHHQHAPAPVSTMTTSTTLASTSFVDSPVIDTAAVDPTCEHMGHMMMTFHFGYCEDVLFTGWQIRSVGTLLGSMIGIFIMAILYEGLKYYREYLFWRSSNSIQYRTVNAAHKAGGEEAQKVVQMVPEIIHHQPPSMLSKVHALQTLLHIIQIILSYFLMLIFMTFNVWLCLAVVAGATVGYFLFGWKKSVIVDVTEHCH